MSSLMPVVHYQKKIANSLADFGVKDCKLYYQNLLASNKLPVLQKIITFLVQDWNYI